MKGVFIETKHLAHICIVTADTRKYNEAKDAIDSKVAEVLTEFKEVHEDRDFRCNVLTEVGLESHNLEQLTLATNAIATWASTSELTELVDL